MSGHTGKHPHAERFTDLIVYEKSRQLANDVFQLTRKFPREELFCLTDQIRRSSRSIGAQIAEAWARRKYERHFVSKLTDADGEQLETEHWLTIACDCEYLTAEMHDALIGQCQEIGRMLHSMMDKSAAFCGNLNDRVREENAEYFCDDEPEGPMQ